MTKVHERVFAWVAVLVVIISAGALSGAFIIQEIMARQSPQTADQTIDTCTLQAVADPTKLTAPAKYKGAPSVATLKTTDVKVGSGAAAKAGDCLVVKYYGMLASNGVVFDENYTAAQALQFKLGVGDVIKGWDDGLIGMKPGGERQLIIPSDLAYGSMGSGSIPADATLVFYVQLLKIQ